MCNALEELRREGEREGRLEGIRATIRICKKFSISEEDIIRNIMEEFSLSQEEFFGYVKHITRSTNESLQLTSPYSIKTSASVTGAFFCAPGGARRK